MKQLEFEFKDIDEIDDIDEAYWEQQPQIVMPNYSNYVIFPKQGLIWSKKTNKWVGNKNKKTGYWQCNLTSDDGKEWKTNLHRVIWVACNGNIPQGLQVNHIDETPSNNSISNLNLLTPKENANWGTRNERARKAISKAKKGKIPKAKPPKQVGAFKNGTLIMVFPSTREAERNGFDHRNVSACCRGCYNRPGNNTYKGFQWQYIN